MATWWNQSYPFRREVDIESYTTLPPGHPVTVVLDRSFVDSGKVRTDFADIIVTYIDANGVANPIPRKVVQNALGINISFDVINSEEDQFYLYYGNIDLRDAPIVSVYNENLWPLSVYPEEGRISYTSPGNHWVAGVSSTNLARATFRFSGERVRIISDTGKNKGKFLVKLNNISQEVVDLSEFGDDEDVVVYESGSISQNILATSIDPVAPVEIQIIVQENKSVNIKRIDYSIGMSVSTSLEEVSDALTWTTFTGSV